MPELSEARLKEIKNEKLVSYEEAWEVIDELIAALRDAWRERDQDPEGIVLTPPPHKVVSTMIAISKSEFQKFQERADRAEASLAQLREAAEAIDWDDIICTLESYDLEMGAGSIPNTDVAKIKDLQRVLASAKDPAR